jgi:hypothetical protein
MLSHAKAEMLDALLHRLLGMCMAAVAAAVIAHGVWPRSFALGAAKSLALILEVSNNADAALGHALLLMLLLTQWLDSDAGA